MAFAQIEDKESKAELIIFPRVFQKIEQWLLNYDVFVVKGAFDLASTTMCKIKVNEMIPVELFLDQWPTISAAQFILPTSIRNEDLLELKKQIPSGKTSLEIIFYENGKQLRLKTRSKININKEIIGKLEEKDILVKLTI